VDYADLDRAIDKLTEAVRLDPMFAGAYCDRGIAYRLRNAMENSAADFTRALDIDPLDAHVYYERAYTYLKMERATDAVADAGQAVRIRPDYDDAYALRAGADVALGTFNQALSDANRAIALNGRNVAAYVNRALAYNALGDTAAAQKDLDDAVQFSPEDWIAIYNHGYVYTQTIQGYYTTAHPGALIPGTAERDTLAKAIADFSKVIELRPCDSRAYCSRGCAYQKLGETDRARADFSFARDRGRECNCSAK
jgi:Flp pilus assembly protein TadD